MASKILSDPGEQDAFISALVKPKPMPGAVIWTKERPVTLPFQLAPRLEWQPSFVDRVSSQEKPGSHDLHEAGYYYCLDFSSVTHAALLSAIRDQEIETIVDVCAAPGGKSIFASRYFEPKLLISNEVINKRIPSLISNLKRCSIQSAAVSSLDPEVLTTRYPSCFDLTIVDAPCSGQSLLARDQESKGCFHPATVNMNSNRQKKILANSAGLVRGGGYLLYVTCTFSFEENERVVEWFLSHFPEFQVLDAPELSSFRSNLSEFPTYRSWPQSGMGSGGFSALFQNTSDVPKGKIQLTEQKFVWKNFLV